MKTLKERRMELAYEMQGWIDTEEKILAEFRDDLGEKRPSYVFTWSGRAVAAAASTEAYQIIKHYIEDISRADSSVALLGILEEILVEELARRAEFPERSTSPMSNLVHQEGTVAWAKALRWVRRRLDAEKRSANENE